MARAREFTRRKPRKKGGRRRKPRSAVRGERTKKGY